MGYPLLFARAKYDLAAAIFSARREYFVSARSNTKQRTRGRGEKKAEFSHGAV